VIDTHRTLHVYGTSNANALMSRARSDPYFDVIINFSLRLIEHSVKSAVLPKRQRLAQFNNFSLFQNNDLVTLQSWLQLMSHDENSARVKCLSNNFVDWSRSTCIYINVSSSRTTISLFLIRVLDKQVNCFRLALKCELFVSWVSKLVINCAPVVVRRTFQISSSVHFLKKKSGDISIYVDCSSCKI
jgi:hypothetical protein